MAENTIKLRDKIGPYKGQIRTYLQSAAENAIASGFAEVPTQELPPELPARSELVAAGIEALEDIPRTLRDLMTIPNIGKTKARKLLDALEAEN